jgi:hypothetical protein
MRTLPCLHSVKTMNIHTNSPTTNLPFGIRLIVIDLVSVFARFFLHSLKERLRYIHSAMMTDATTRKLGGANDDTS